MYIQKFSIDNLNIEPLGGENVFDESANGDLRPAQGESGGEQREETSEAEIGVFDGEEERKEVQISEAVEGATAVPVRRRV